MKDLVNTIQHGDCIKRMNALPEGSVDLAFADPPFNIGYDYDVYDDSLECSKYLEWSRQWISAVHRVLKPDGTFWLAIGDEYAAELKVASREVGFHCRSWVIWYYTFGVNCKHKFSRSHVHLFYFIKDRENFTFRADERGNRIPSARALVYNDKRANPRGRLPDDTWIIRPADVVGELTDEEGTWHPDDVESPSDDDRTWTLRPQDLEECFQPDEDTWYFPRVAGTFKERAGFHGCQMPEQLLGRIIRACSHENELVLDPFSGSATTAAVAKKLGRRFLGFDLSKEYVEHGRKRLESIRVGDRLDGSPEPLVSAPSTHGPKRTKGKQRAAAKTESGNNPAQETRYQEIQLELTTRGVIEAFRLSHDGFSADRVVADPDLNCGFIEACQKVGIVGDARHWNSMLFRLRKAGKLAAIPTTRQTSFSWDACDDYLYASEIALEKMLQKGAKTLDVILCDPALATEFDQIAGQFAPGQEPLKYRWAALKLRKQANKARTQASTLKLPKPFAKQTAISAIDTKTIPEKAGLYVVKWPKSKYLYVGGALNLRQRMEAQFRRKQARKVWDEFADNLRIQTYVTESKAVDTLAYQCRLAGEYKPQLNFREMRITT